MRFIVHATVFELDAHIEAVLLAKAQYLVCFFYVVTLMICSPLWMPPVSVLFCMLRMVICHPGWPCCQCTEIIQFDLSAHAGIL